MLDSQKKLFLALLASLALVGCGSANEDDQYAGENSRSSTVHFISMSQLGYVPSGALCSSQHATLYRPGDKLCTEASDGCAIYHAEQRGFEIDSQGACSTSSLKPGEGNDSYQWIMHSEIGYSPQENQLCLQQANVMIHPEQGLCLHATDSCIRAYASNEGFVIDSMNVCLP